MIWSIVILYWKCSSKIHHIFQARNLILYFVDIYDIYSLNANSISEPSHCAMQSHLFHWIIRTSLYVWMRVHIPFLCPDSACLYDQVIFDFQRPVKTLTFIRTKDCSLNWRSWAFEVTPVIACNSVELQYVYVNLQKLLKSFIFLGYVWSISCADII